MDLTACSFALVCLLSQDPSTEYGWHSYEEGDWIRAAQHYQEGIRHGDRLALYNYAIMLLRGENQPADPRQAVQLLHRAARLGLAQSQYALGLLYESGILVNKSLPAATTWFHLAARQGHTDAQVDLATQYYLGRGAAQDYTLAAHWYREAATSGNIGAQYILASLYEHGDGVPRSRRLAIYWYIKAAEQGDPAARMKAMELFQGEN